MREPSWTADDERFDSLAQSLFAFQFSHCGAYARFCVARGVTPERVRHWREIPPVPTGAFKEAPLRCFSATATCKTFRTSGTAAQQRGELHLDTLEPYEASLLATIRHFFFSDLPGAERIAIRVLAPSPVEAPDSSLSHMFGCAIARFGSEASGFDVAGDELDVAGLSSALLRLSEAGEPVAVCGTAFAFVHLIDALAGCGGFELPSGSRIMETGGFKGRSRSITREELHAALHRLTGVAPSRIINQYGMTELGTQFYDSSLVDRDGPRRKLAPPWSRVRIIDPTSGEEQVSGEQGMIVIHDLANTGSVAAIQTADLGVQIGDGFEVQGRDPGAEQRGCSIAADTMLAAPSH